MSAQREWKPGDVAHIGGVDGPALRTIGGRWVTMRADNGSRELCDGSDIARPLVVIDPEDREQVERLFRVLDAHFDGSVRANVPQRDREMMQRALREFTNPTPLKPDEPKGLGAVVEDETGIRWVRAAQAGDPWRPTSGPANWREYGLIKAVRVLSEGVTDAD